MRVGTNFWIFPLLLAEWLVITRSFHYQSYSWRLSHHSSFNSQLNRFISQSQKTTTTNRKFFSQFFAKKRSSSSQNHEEEEEEEETTQSDHKKDAQNSILSDKPPSIRSLIGKIAKEEYQKLPSPPQLPSPLTTAATPTTPSSLESKARKPMKPLPKSSNIYTQPDSVTFTREKMNEQSDHTRKKMTKQELLAEMNDLNQVMSRMEGSLPKKKQTSSSSYSKSSAASKAAQAASSSSFIETEDEDPDFLKDILASTNVPLPFSKAKKGTPSTLPNTENGGKDRSDLDEIEEGFLKFLENNEVDMEFQQIQESLENISEEDLDANLLSLEEEEVEDEDDEEGENNEDFPPEEELSEEDDVERRINQKSSTVTKPKSPAPPAAAASLQNKRSIDEDDEEEEEEDDELNILPFLAAGAKKPIASAKQVPPVNINPNKPTRRKVGRKRKDEEEEFDISSYLDKEFYGNKRQQEAAGGGRKEDDASIIEEDIAEDDEDLFFNEAIKSSSSSSSLPPQQKKLNMKEELSKMEKVLRNFDQDRPSNNLDQYSLPTSSTFNAPDPANARKVKQAQKKKTSNGDDDEEEEEGVEEMDLEGVDFNDLGDDSEAEGMFDEEARKSLEEELKELQKLSRGGGIGGGNEKKKKSKASTGTGAMKNQAADPWDEEGDFDGFEGDIEDGEEDINDGDFFSSSKQSSSRSPYKTNYQLEDGHNITAEEMKEVLSSFDEDPSASFSQNTPPSSPPSSSRSTRPGVTGAAATAGGVGTAGGGSVGGQFEFDFDSLFQRMNRTETLEKELLLERAQKKENEIQKIRLKLAQLARINKKTASTAKDKRNAVRDLQIQLLALQDELSSLERMQDDSSYSQEDDYEDPAEAGGGGGGVGQRERERERKREEQEEDDREIMTQEEYALLEGTTTAGGKRRRSQKKTIRNYYQDLMKGPTTTESEEDPEGEEERESEEDDLFDENLLLEGEQSSSSSSSSKEKDRVSAENTAALTAQMTEEQLVRANILFDENDMRRETLKLTQTIVVPTRKVSSKEEDEDEDGWEKEEIVNTTITAPLIIDARYPDWKLDMRDYVANINVTKIITEGPNWDLLPSPNDTELLRYAQQIYKRLSREQDLFYDHTYAYIPHSLREERNMEGKVISTPPPLRYPTEEHDIHLQLAADEPMHSRLVVTTVLTAMNTTTELEKGIQVIRKLYEVFDKELLGDDRVEYQLWIYCEDFIRNPYVIAEPIFRRYSYNLTAYLSDLSPEEKLFVAAQRTTAVLQQLRKMKAKKRATGQEEPAAVPVLATAAAAVAQGEEETSLLKADNNKNKTATPRVTVTIDQENYVNYYYLQSQDYQNQLKEAIDKQFLQSEELWRSTLEGTIQMWCEGYNSYHLINGKLMRDLWGGINPEVLFAPKNLEILINRLKKALDEDTYDAVTLPARMYNDWKVGDMLYPPEDLTEIDYNLTV